MCGETRNDRNIQKHQNHQRTCYLQKVDRNHAISGIHACANEEARLQHDAVERMGRKTVQLFRLDEQDLQFSLSDLVKCRLMKAFKL